MKTEGYLHRKQSYNKEKVSQFVSFNDSFLKDLGLQFFFKDGPKRIEIQAFSSNPAFKDISYKLVFHSKISYTIKGNLNSSEVHRFPLMESIQKKDMMQYSISVQFYDEPIVIE